MLHVLTLNPGSTSTRVAVFQDHVVLAETTLQHSDADLAAFCREPVIAQLPFRAAAIHAWLRGASLEETPWSAVCARGGLLPPLESGTYSVDEHMLADLERATRGQHASNLGAFLAANFAKPARCPAFIVDPVSVDELDAVARISGLAGLERSALSHALNTKAVARRYAHEEQQEYAGLRLIVAHMGSGISVSAHRDGRMVDVNNSREEGPFSTERAGSLPALSLVQRAIAEQWTADDAERRLFREGGIYSYLHTRDLTQILRDARPEAMLIVDAMLYQAGKEIAAMAAVLQGEVSAILLTGGMAHSEYVTRKITHAVDWIAPVRVYPGEDEQRALAEGALRVLRGEEVVRNYMAVQAQPISQPYSREIVGMRDVALGSA